MHIEFLVEEESAAEAIKLLVPKMIGDRASFEIHTFQGKQDLLNKLPNRLRGYAKWIPDDRQIVVLVDRDGDDCTKLKVSLERMADSAGLVTPANIKAHRRIQVLNRIAIEELEAWYFGDIEALSKAYPRVSRTLSSKRGYRDPDAITGGTWEKLERVLQNAGHYREGMPKIEVARKVAPLMEPARNKSHSFKAFFDGLKQLVM